MRPKVTLIEKKWRDGGRNEQVFKEMAVADLQEELAGRGQSSKGRKNELVERLQSLFVARFGTAPSPVSSDDEQEPPEKYAKLGENEATEVDLNLRRKLVKIMTKPGFAAASSASSSGAGDENAPPGADFCVSIPVESLPQMEILGGEGGHWEVKYPIDAEVGAKLASFAEQAPVGRGEQTVMDRQVRDGLQIDATRIKFGSKKWQDLFLDSKKSQLLEQIRKVLAPSCGKISAKFYKLLVYPKGSFFKPHRDTQREAHHFGSIVVFLPCRYSGGALTVKHGGTQQQFSYSVGKAYDGLKCHAVAFFTDCLHEVLPITDGYRVTLSYQLFYEGDLAPQPPPTSDALSGRLSTIFAKLFALAPWKGMTAGVVLEHKYALSSLKPDLLKGNDRIVYDAIKASQNLDIEFVGIEVGANGLGEMDSRAPSASKLYSMGLYGRGNYDNIYLHVSRLVPGADKKNKFASSDDKANLLCELEYPPGDYPSDGDVIFISDWRDVNVGKPDHSESEASGNEGTEWSLSYKKAAFLIKPKAMTAPLKK